MSEGSITDILSREIITFQQKVNTLQSDLDEAVRLLKDISSQVERSEYWWMGIPEKGGLNMESIEHFLGKIK